MPSLRLTAPGHPPTIYHLHKKITSLGSGPDNDIVLPDPLVTDGYAIHFDGQTYTVFAPKKTEFVVNGKKRSKHKLSHDERLVIGSIDLRFAMVDEAPPVEAEAVDQRPEVGLRVGGTRAGTGQREELTLRAKGGEGPAVNE